MNIKRGEHMDNKIVSLFKKKIKNKIKILILALSPMLIVLMVVVLLLASIGDMGGNIVSGKLSSSDNKEVLENLSRYLEKEINIPNDDYYGITEKFFLTKGNVMGYIKFIETREGKNIDEILGKSLSEATYYYADKLKPKFTFTYMSKQDVIKKKATNDLEGDSTETHEGSIKLLTHVSCIYGEIDLVYSYQTNEYTDKEGEHTETLPVYVEYKLNGELFSNLKKLIKKDYPKEEDLDMALTFVVNSRYNFDKETYDGEWINKIPGEFVIDELINSALMDGEGGSFDGIIPLFLQYDPKWANHPYEGYNIRRGGCGAVCLAMVVTGLEGELGSWDKNNDGIFTPDEAADFSHSYGCDPVGNGTDGVKLYPLVNKFGLRAKYYSKSNYKEVLKELNNGCPVIANVHGSRSIPYGQAGSTFTQNGHFIVLTGIDSNGKVKVNDPANAENSNKVFDFESIIVAESSDFWVFDNPKLSNAPLSRVYKYKDIKNPDKIKNYIKKVSNGHIADEPHFSTVVKVAKDFNLNPFVLLSITGAEQSFATKKFGDYSMVIKNPYNVYGSWQVYHPGLEKSSQIAARTVINLSKESKVKSKDVFERIGETYVQSPGWRDWVKICKQYFDTFSELDN
ncbi:hypothetical protein C3B72_12450 [Clostridium tetani]|nr:hypothetical protein C3B72_12450 [Clostridium tetani]RXI78835.1 hypothetical protein DP128_00230 [Clostridium tetani]RXM72423.1 hypothetical protein DP139_01225 [Clostridium tetani]